LFGANIIAGGRGVSHGLFDFYGHQIGYSSPADLSHDLVSCCSSPLLHSLRIIIAGIGLGGQQVWPCQHNGVHTFAK